MTKDKETIPEPVKQKEKMEAKTFATIDIGSNSARLLIKRFNDSTPQFERSKRVMFVRIPLRLGKDVFTLSKISKDRATMVMHMMKGFKQFMLLYQVDQYRACTTAAIRDADNEKRIMKEIEYETGIRLEIIRGEGEARLLCNSTIEQTNSQTGNFAYINVGGGNTGISLPHDDTLAESHSFDMSTLHILNSKVTNVIKHQMRDILNECAGYFPDTQIIGSSGNTNRLFRLTHDKNGEKQMEVEELKEIHETLSKLSEEERKGGYGPKGDRVDVIIPAAEIFLMVAKALKCNTIYVPNISLADSIIDSSYRKCCQTK